MEVVDVDQPLPQAEAAPQSIDTVKLWAPTGLCDQPPAAKPPAKINVPTVAISARIGILLELNYWACILNELHGWTKEASIGRRRPGL